MTLIRSNSFLPAFPQFFDDFFTRDLMDWGTRNNSTTNTTIPAVNIFEEYYEYKSNDTNSEM
jgi:HSP20 family protein